MSADTFIYSPAMDKRLRSLARNAGKEQQALYEQLADTKFLLDAFGNGDEHHKLGRTGLHTVSERGGYRVLRFIGTSRDGTRLEQYLGACPDSDAEILADARYPAWVATIDRLREENNCRASSSLFGMFLAGHAAAGKLSSSRRSKLATAVRRHSLDELRRAVTDRDMSLWDCAEAPAGALDTEARGAKHRRSKARSATPEGALMAAQNAFLALDKFSSADLPFAAIADRMSPRQRRGLKPVL